MTREELRHLLDVYGGDPARWPADRRAAALELVRCDARAARMLEEARALARLLDAASPPACTRTPAHLAAMVMAAASARKEERKASPPLRKKAEASVERRGRAQSPSPTPAEPARNADVIPFPAQQHSKRRSRAGAAAARVASAGHGLPARGPRHGRTGASDKEEAAPPLPWLAAGVLAASLLLGVLLGSGISRSPLGEALLDPARMALADEGTGMGEIMELASPLNGGDLP
jgi:hypothetical protein